MPPRVASSFRAQTAMGCWTTNLRMFTCLGAQSTQSVRSLVQQTGGAQSRVPRLTPATKRRDVSPEV
jgi:hypothetical protein